MDRMTTKVSVFLLVSETNIRVQTNYKFYTRTRMRVSLNRANISARSLISHNNLVLNYQRDVT